MNFDSVPGQIAFVGNILLDVVVKVPAHEVQLLGSDEISDVVTRIGGSASHGSMAIAESDSPPHIVGGVGKDAVGLNLAAEVRKSGVQTQYLTQSGTTGVVVVLADNNGRRTMFHNPGQCNILPTVLPNRQWRIIATNSRYLHEPANQHLLAWLSTSTLDYLVIDLADVADLRKVVASIRNMQVNAKHQLILTGGSAAVEQLRRFGAFGSMPWVIETRGAAPIQVWQHGNITHSVRIQEVRNVDTTAAGDVFLAGFCRGLLEHSIAESVDMAKGVVHRILVARSGSRTVL